MTRIEFLRELEILLKDIPELERRDILLDFEEHFFNAMESGKDEEEVIAGLGSPKMIAREVKANFYINQAQSQSSVSSMGRAIISTVSLGFINLVLVLGPAIAVVSVVFSFYMVSLGLVVAAAGLVGMYFAEVIAVKLQEVLFPAMALGGLGVMIGVGTIYLTKWIYGLFVRYLEFNLRIIKGDRA